MKLGNKLSGKMSTMGNKVQMLSVLGNKILNTKPNGVVSYPKSDQSMHHTLVNNIGNSAHSVYIPTGITHKPKSDKKNYLEKH